MGTQTDNRLRLFTPGGGKRLKLRGLRRRWLASSVGPIVIILVLTGILTAVTISSNLYGRARSTLEAKAKSGADYFSAYSMGSYSEYYRRAAQYTADFATSDSLGKTVELQFINGKRQVELSTRGAVAGSTPATMDVNRAVETGKTATFTGRDPLTGENILAVSSPLFYNGAVVGVMRYVTSTHLMDQQLWLTVLVIAAIIAAVIFLIFVSNLIFINNVVTPVAEVSEAAKRISSGSYGIQISNKYSRRAAASEARCAVGSPAGCPLPGDKSPARGFCGGCEPAHGPPPHQWLPWDSASGTGKSTDCFFRSSCPSGSVRR